MLSSCVQQTIGFVEQPVNDLLENDKRSAQSTLASRRLRSCCGSELHQRPHLYVGEPSRRDSAGRLDNESFSWVGEYAMPLSAFPKPPRIPVNRIAKNVIQNKIETDMQRAAGHWE
jgi:hypothetical protein